MVFTVMDIVIEVRKIAEQSNWSIDNSWFNQITSSWENFFEQTPVNKIGSISWENNIFKKELYKEGNEIISSSFFHFIDFYTSFLHFLILALTKIVLHQLLFYIYTSFLLYQLMNLLFLNHLNLL